MIYLKTKKNKKNGRVTHPRVHATAPRMGDGRSAPSPVADGRIGDGRAAPTPRFRAPRV